MEEQEENTEENSDRVIRLEDSEDVGIENNNSLPSSSGVPDRDNVHTSAVNLDEHPSTSSTVRAELHNQAGISRSHSADEMEVFIDAPEEANVQLERNQESSSESDDDMYSIHSEDEPNAVGLLEIEADGNNILGDVDDHNESEATSSDDNDGQSGEERLITFDQSTPSSHSYLGNDLRDIPDRVIFDDDDEVSLLAYLHHGVVLVPGQTLPLQVTRPSLVAMLRTAVEQQKTVAILHTNPSVDGDNTWGVPPLASIGTTAQVLSISSEAPDAGGATPYIRAITIGRQRFHLLEVKRMQERLLSAKVRILPEKEVGDPLEGIIPQSHYQPRTLFTDYQVNTSEKMKRVQKYSYYLTPWPDWVYKQYLPHDLIGQVKKELRQWGDQTMNVVENMNSPEQLSYWLAANLPISDYQKLNILRLDSSIQRLRYEIGLMQKFASLCCRNCGHPIAKRSDVFSLSYEGPMGTFVNPHGAIHEILTVYKAKHLSLSGSPETEFSWFPGYAWTIINCKTCGLHKGWRFTARSSRLKPTLFYGLTRAGLQSDMREMNDNSQSSRCVLF